MTFMKASLARCQKNTLFFGNESNTEGFFLIGVVYETQHFAVMPLLVYPFVSLWHLFNYSVRLDKI